MEMKEEPQDRPPPDREGPETKASEASSELSRSSERRTMLPEDLGNESPRRKRVH